MVSLSSVLGSLDVRETLSVIFSPLLGMSWVVALFGHGTHHVCFPRAASVPICSLFWFVIALRLPTGHFPSGQVQFQALVHNEMHLLLFPVKPIFSFEGGSRDGQ